MRMLANFDQLMRALRVLGVCTALLAFTLLTPSSTRAQEIKLRNTADTCNAAAEGALRYNNGTDTFEQCNGASWAGLNAGGSGWTASGSNVYLTTTSNNIGIGTTAPVAKLDVTGTGGGVNWLRIGDVTYSLVSVDNWGTTTFGRNVIINPTVGSAYSDVTDRSLQIIGKSGQTGNILELNSYGTGSGYRGDLLVVKPNGNVGIGSTAPQTKLDVEGNVYVGNGNVGIGTTVPSAPLTIFQGSTNRMTLVDDRSVSFTRSYEGYVIAGIEYIDSTDLRLFSDGTVTLYPNNRYALIASDVDNIGKVRIGDVAPVAGGARLEVEGSLAVGSTYASATTVPANGLVVEGSVGIGSSAPQAKLDVEGSIYVGNGNVGIGTTSPSTPLHIGTNGNGITLGDGTFATNYINFSGGRGSIGSDGNNTIIQSTGGKGISFNVNDGTFGYGTAMRINESGNVGINSIAPQAKLDVEGSAYFGNGNIGVGSSAPSQKVDVLGTVKATAFIGDGSGLTGVGGSISGLNAGYITKASSSTTINNSAIYQSGSNIGVGTTDPISLFDIAGKFWVDSSGPTVNIGDNSSNVWINLNSVSYGGSNIQSARPLNINGAGNIPIMTFADYNVGIGSAVPQAKLDVEGSAYFGNGNVGIGTTVPGALLQVEGMSAAGGTLRLSNNNTNASAGDVTGMIDFYSSDTQSAKIVGYIKSAEVNGTGQHNLILGNSYGDGGAAQDLVTLGPWGTVGIGVDVGAGKFSVLTNSGTGAWAASFVATDSLSASGVLINTNTNLNSYFGLLVSGPSSRVDLAVTGSGNVGIGSSVPQTKLDVEGNVYVGDAGVAGSGNVGIGSVAPSQKVDVIGTVKATAFIGDGSGLTGITGASSQWITNGTSIYYNNGNVGIGSSAPEATLHVRNHDAVNDYDILPVMTLQSDALTVQYMDTFSNTNWASPIWRARRARGTMDSPQSIAAGDELARWSAYGYDGSSYGEAALIDMSVGNTRTSGMPGNISFFTTPDQSTDLVQRMIIDQYGNVGINSATPQAKLDVEGSAYFGNGNVGIGTTSPAASLQITRNDYNDSLTLDRTGVGKWSFSIASNNIAGTDLRLIAGNSAASFTIQNNTDANVFTVRADTGKVGIGTTAPLAKLELIGAGTTTASQSLVVRNSSAAATLTVTDGQKVIVNGTLSPWQYFAVKDNADNAIFGVGNISGPAIIIGGSGGDDPSGSSGGKHEIHFNSEGQEGSLFWDTADRRFHFTDGQDYNVLVPVVTGNIGAGSSAPNARLEIVGTGTTSATAALVIRDSTAAVKVTVLDNGNVGIGTTNPASQFQIGTGVSWVTGAAMNIAGNIYTTGTFSIDQNIADANATIQLIGRNGGVAHNTYIYADWGGGLNLNSEASQPIYFKQNGAEAMRISSAGSVGIGTTVPQAKLDVEGSAYFGNGNIGVGSSAPSQKVDVLGTVKATAFIGDGSGLSGISGAVSGLNTGYLTKSSSATTIDNSAIYQNGTNIGIGTTTPDTKLQVSGIAKISRTTNANQWISLSNEGGDAYFNASADGAAENIYFQQAGATKMTIKDTGNVGIGTTNPRGTLDVEGGTAVSGDGSNITLAAQNGQQSGNTNGGNIILTPGIGFGGGGRLGYVGIGTSAPHQKLEIYGTPGTGFATIRLTDGTPQGPTTNNSWDIMSVYNYTNPDLVFSTVDATTWWTGSEKFRVNANGQMCLGYNGEDGCIGSGGLLVDGNVGIGTTGPAARLHIAQDGVWDNNATFNQLWISGTTDGTTGLGFGYDTTGDFAFIEAADKSSSWRSLSFVATSYSFLTSAGNEKLTILNNGNVGIGTAGLGAKLDINPGTGRAIQVTSADTEYELYFKGAYNADIFAEGDLYMKPGTGKMLRLGSNNVNDQMVINNGNVGIGTTSPTSALVVQTAGAGNAGLTVSSGVWGPSIGTISGSSGGVLYLQPENQVSMQTAGAGNAFLTMSTGIWGGTLGTIAGSSDGNLGLAPASNVVRLYNGGSNAMVMDMYNGETKTILLKTNGDSYLNGGNVGIGTTGPQVKLDVQGNAGAGTYVRALDNWQGGLVVESTATQGRRYSLLSNDLGTFQIFDSGHLSSGGQGPVLAINANGYVGIGTTAPMTKLDVSGQYRSIQVTTTTTLDWNSGNVQYIQLASGGQTFTFANPQGGARYMLILKQPGTGAAGTVSWPGEVLWPSGAAPVLTGTNNKADVITFVYDTANSKYYAGSSLNY